MRFLGKMVAGTLIVLVTLTIVVVGCSAAATAAPMRGYTCNYSKAGVTASIDGSDNSRSMCRIFNNGFGARSTYSHPGRVFCTWQMIYSDVRVRVFSTSRLTGLTFCALLAPQIDSSDWRRVR